MTVIGFTGTRRGMTDAQRATLGTLLLLDIGQVAEFHHGSCRGADVEAAWLVRSSFAKAKIVCHPGPTDDLNQVHSGVDDETREPKTHFARNRDIVDACDVIFGCPSVDVWQSKGGTFYTMDYTLKRRKPLVVVWPDGRAEKYGE